MYGAHQSRNSDSCPFLFLLLFFYGSSLRFIAPATAAALATKSAGAPAVLRGVHEAAATAAAPAARAVRGICGGTAISEEAQGAGVRAAAHVRGLVRAGRVCRGEGHHCAAPVERDGLHGAAAAPAGGAARLWHWHEQDAVAGHEAAEQEAPTQLAGDQGGGDGVGHAGEEGRAQSDEERDAGKVWLVVVLIAFCRGVSCWFP